MTVIESAAQSHTDVVVTCPKQDCQTPISGYDLDEALFLLGIHQRLHNH